MKGSVKRYCSCADPGTGRQYGAKCPTLVASTKHGQWDYRERIPSSAGLRELRRRAFPTRTAANGFRDDAHALLKLAKGDTGTAARIGDLIFDRTKRGGQLPEAEDVQRRLGLRGALDRSQTLAEWLDSWIAGKKRLRASTTDSYSGHIVTYLKPMLGHIPLDRLGEQHVHDMFDLIEEWNTEIELAKLGGRKPACDGDTRRRSMKVGISTQHRIFATLRNALNAARKSRRVDVNICDFVELLPETRIPVRVWTPEQVGHFLEFTEGDRLRLLWRLVLLRGLRRGEAIGLRWEDVVEDDRLLLVRSTVLQIGGKVVAGVPKTRAGEREVSLDADSAELIAAQRARQAVERDILGDAYADLDLVFAWEDGTTLRPDYVSRRFKMLGVAAGLPEISLHMGRHTAATLGLEAGLDIKVVSDQLGHANTNITQNLYQHVRRTVHATAAEAVVALLPPRPRNDGPDRQTSRGQAAAKPAPAATGE